MVFGSVAVDPRQGHLPLGGLVATFLFLAKSFRRRDFSLLSKDTLEAPSATLLELSSSPRLY